MNVVIKLKLYPSKAQEEQLKTITLDYLEINFEKGLQYNPKPYPGC